MLNDVAEEEVNLLVPIHRAPVLLLLLLLALPEIVEFISIHSILFLRCRLKLAVLLFVLNPEDVVLAVDSVLGILVCDILLFLQHEHEGTGEELIPHLQHFIGREDATSFLHFLHRILCYDILDKLTLLLLFAELIVVEEGSHL